MRSRTALRLLVALVAAGCGGDDGPGGGGVPLKVMTRNLYLGSDLTPAVMAPTIDEIPVRVAELWSNILASDIPARIQALADEIAAARPDLVGLQEVALFRMDEKSNFSFAAPLIDAAEVRFDFLALIRKALQDRGLAYQEIVSENTDVELPGGPEGARFDLRLTDRDVILVREGLTIVRQQTMQYTSRLEFPLPLMPPPGTAVRVKLVRGLGLAEVDVAGTRVTFVNTHLEVGGGPGGILTSLQEGQARDLMTALDGVRGPVVLLGDFNSPADGTGSRSYATVTARFEDFWSRVKRGDAGLTCCVDLRAPTYDGRVRIDIVFGRGGVRAQALERVGVDPARRTPSGLWPSDHAGVVADLLVGS